MNTQLQLAKSALFGESGLGVSNIKMFPGSNREVTAEELAQQVAAVVGEILSGELEDIDCAAY